MEKISLKTLKSLYDEFQTLAETSEYAKQDLEDISNVIVMLLVRDLVKNDLAEQN